MQKSKNRHTVFSAPFKFQLISNPKILRLKPDSVQSSKAISSRLQTVHRCGEENILSRFSGIEGLMKRKKIGNFLSFHLPFEASRRKERNHHMGYSASILPRAASYTVSCPLQPAVRQAVVSRSVAGNPAT